jgi:hypothetical protein
VMDLINIIIKKVIRLLNGDQIVMMDLTSIWTHAALVIHTISDYIPKLSVKNNAGSIHGRVQMGINALI